MSLFRTLQHSPATISIFHNSKVPKSAALYSLLDKSYFQLNNDKNLFQVDVVADQMPTYDQYILIYQQYAKDSASNHILKGCFPFMFDQKSANAKGCVTITSPVGLLSQTQNNAADRIKFFTEGEYAMIHEAFNSLTEEGADASQLFLAPLVVDWDQQLIANDETTLSAILHKYREEASDPSLSTA